MSDDFESNLGAQLATLAREAVPSEDASAANLVDIEPRRSGATRRALAIAAAVTVVIAAGVGVAIAHQSHGVSVSHVPPLTAPPSPTSPVSVRAEHATVFTGKEVLVWGGTRDALDGVTPTSLAGKPAPKRSVVADGGVYDVESISWRPMAPAPIDGRIDPQAVWTGHEMIVLGGSRDTSGDNGPEYLRDGAAYDPARDTWHRITAAPTPCLDRATWTGTEVVAGGNCQSGDGASTMVAYDPTTDRWTSLPELPSYITGLTTVNGRVVGWTVHDGGYVLANDHRSWTPLPPLPDAGTIIDNTLMMSSGKAIVIVTSEARGNKMTTGIYRLDMTTQRWERHESTEPVPPLYGTTPIANDGDIVVWGSLPTDEPSVLHKYGFSWMNASTGAGGLVDDALRYPERTGESFVALGNHRFFVWGGALAQPDKGQYADPGVFSVPYA